MWEFLVFSPFNIVLSSFAVVIMMSLRSCIKLGLESLFNLVEFSMSWLSPSVEMVEEHVVKMDWISELWRIGSEVWWDIHSFLDVAWSDLSNVHIYHQGIITIDLKQFIFSEGFWIDVSLDVDPFVWKDDVWMSVFISWGFKVVNLDISIHLVFIVAEVIVALSCNLSIGVLSKTSCLFLRNCFFKASKCDFFCNEFVNSFLYLGNLWMI
jgi:hypothetical protein